MAPSEQPVSPPHDTESPLKKRKLTTDSNSQSPIAATSPAKEDTKDGDDGDDDDGETGNLVIKEEESDGEETPVTRHMTLPLPPTAASRSKQVLLQPRTTPLSTTRSQPIDSTSTEAYYGKSRAKNQ